MCVNRVSSALITALVVMLSGWSASAQQVKIKLSPHDLSGYANAKGEVCLPCHTPHNANVLANGQLLWNHQVSNETYTLYTAIHATVYTTQGNKSSLNPVLDPASRMCLGCHDGNIAMDNFGGTTTGGTHKMTGINAIASDADKLGNDHPVGIGYPGLSGDGKTFDAANAKGYFDPTSATWGSGGVNGTLAVQLMPLVDGRQGIGCSTCHTSHDYTYKFLRMDNTGSALCYKCHDK